VWLSGEILEIRRDIRGHWRFMLRDEECRVDCVWWGAAGQDAMARLSNGMQVVALATPSVHTRTLSFSCVVTAVRHAGEGERQRTLDRLRISLRREGLFDDRKKRRLPRVPQCVGVITSRGSAAWHDVLAIATARHPGLPIVLVPAEMQGAGAPSSIVAAISRVQRARVFDVVIITRGGGAAADLQAFDDEAVARAIASCSVPIVTAIGHELDLSIADLVADVRAATPSAAAVLVVPARCDLAAELRRHACAMESGVERHLERHQARLESIRAGMARVGLLRVQRARQRVERLEGELERASQQLLRRHSDSLRQFAVAMTVRIEQHLAATLAHRDRLAVQLVALSPRAILGRGYAVAIAQSGEVLSSVTRFRPDEPFTVLVADGAVSARVVSVSHPSTE
jgi:exodeoxyribonuclease VII large subunit